MLFHGVALYVWKPEERFWVDPVLVLAFFGGGQAGAV